jgi:hypothetical protein
MINILVRTSNRPELFKRMYASVLAQTFTDWRLVIGFDTDEALKYIPLHPKIFRVKVNPQREHLFFWNLYCNDLKAQVTDGWFFYLDDDDYLVSRHSLARIAEHLTIDHGTICQFIRNGKRKPHQIYIDSKKIIRGKIGGSCIFLHHSHKHLADWDGGKAADYRFLKDIEAKLPLQFVAVPVVIAGNNGLHGKLN